MDAEADHRAFLIPLRCWEKCKLATRPIRVFLSMVRDLPPAQVGLSGDMSCYTRVGSSAGHHCSRNSAEIGSRAIYYQGKATPLARSSRR